MKAELRNRGRHPNGMVKSAQLRFARLPNQTPSQSVAVSRSDLWERRRNGWCAVLQRTPLPACGLPLPAKRGEGRERGSGNVP
jgi:hypothetical protein